MYIITTKSNQNKYQKCENIGHPRDTTQTEKTKNIPKFMKMHDRKKITKILNISENKNNKKTIKAK